jgi:hypothetical protein
MTYWQIMNGDAGRDYSQVFFEFGVALAGPGDNGPLDLVDTAKNGKYSASDLAKIWPLTQMKRGDRIILKAGQTEMLAVGDVLEVDGKIYQYSNRFSDIDGWDLQHHVRVAWRTLPHTFAKRLLTRSTLEKCVQKEVIAHIEKNWGKAVEVGSPFTAHHTDQHVRLTFEEFEQQLIDGGVGIEAAERISHTVRRVSKLSKWYKDSHAWSSEHEIRTFLVVPFLQALGWYPQQVGIEVPLDGSRKKLDIVLYQSATRLDAVMLIETKRMGQGSFGASNQALSYIKGSPQFASLQYYCTTDGLRYWLHKRVADRWNPFAYMRLDNPSRKNVAYPNCGGTMVFINHMIPSEHDVKFNLLDTP